MGNWRPKAMVWDGSSSKHERSFARAAGIGRGPRLGIAEASRYEPQIPQALRERMAAYDANPDPHARPHGEARRQAMADRSFWTVPETWQPPKGSRRWLIEALNVARAVLVEIGHGFDVASMKGAPWGGERTDRIYVAVMEWLHRSFTSAGLRADYAAMRVNGLRLQPASERRL